MAALFPEPVSAGIPASLAAAERRMIEHVARTIAPEAFAAADPTAMPAARQLAEASLRALGVPLFVLLGIWDPVADG